MSKFNPEEKFKFLGENMNQSDYGNYGYYGSIERDDKTLIVS